MRKRLVVLPAVFALLGPAGAVAFHGQRVYIANRGCAGHAYRPSAVTLACGDGNLYATGIRYRAYGQTVAVATATMHLNDCMPNCAAGRFRRHRGALTFRGVVRCADGRLYYSRARYSFKGPFGSGVANIAPLEGRCSRAIG